MKKSEYNIELYYGYEEGECGIYHAFEATDPSVCADTAAMGEHLAEMLECEVESNDFNFDSMLIRLPDTVVERIKKDGVKEYLTRTGKKGA